MESLRILRESHPRDDELPRPSLEEVPPEATLRMYLELRRAVAPHLEETEELFGPPRRRALRELQERLRRLGR